MKYHFAAVLFIILCAMNYVSCVADEKKVFNEREHIKKLQVDKIVVTTYPYKFGKIDTTNGFVSNIISYDTNGYLIKYEHFDKGEYTREFSYTTIVTFTNNYKNSKTENYDHQNSLRDIYIDSLNNDKFIERKIFNKNGKMTGLIKYKYNSDNLVEILSYDSNGTIESKNIISYEKNKEVRNIEYDKYGSIKNRTITDHYNNYFISKSFDADGKIQYKSKKIFPNGYVSVSEFTSYSSQKENDSTVIKNEYTYQDSILLKQDFYYLNNEIQSADIYKVYKRG